MPAEGGDAVAFVGDNRKMLIVKLDDIPLMTRGRGVILQRYKSGGLADCKVFRLADGLSWRQGENRTRTETDLTPWLGARGAAGRLVPERLPALEPLRLTRFRCFCCYLQEINSGGVSSSAEILGFDHRVGKRTAGAGLCSRSLG